MVPQIKAAKLQTLPFPRQADWEQRAPRLSRACRERLELAGRAASDSDDQRLKNQIAAVEEHIEELSATLYAFDDDEIGVIKTGVSESQS